MSYDAAGDFSGRVVVVTGGTRGIGQAMASAYAEAGAEVIITGTSPTLPKEAVRGAGYLQADFSDAASTDAFVKSLDSLPRLDVLVNNAGINRIARLTDLSDADYETVLSVNLHAPVKCCRVAAKKMTSAGYGRILNVASIWSVITKPGRSAYAAAKAGLVGLTRTLAVEVADRNVMVNALSPGFTATELTQSTLSADEMTALAQQVPARRFATPDEMARVALFLTSASNSYLTGQNIVVDGGFVNV